MASKLRIIRPGAVTEISPEVYGHTHEPEVKIFGEHHLRRVPLCNLITLSQTRSGPNPEHEHLVESINRIGLLNNPDAVYVGPEELQDYIDFVNKTWGSTHIIEDYDPDAEGMYTLIIAGHSRVNAIRELAQKFGYINSLVKCKIHPASNPEDIISIQMDENLHSPPPPERNAIVIVEAYLFGIQKGRWSGKAEFVESTKGKVSRYSLNNALYFLDLPMEFRELVLCGGISYLSAIELAKNCPMYRDYISAKYWDSTSYDNLDLDSAEKVDKEVFDWYQSTILQIQEKKISGAKVKKMMGSYATNWSRFCDEFRSRDEMFVDSGYQEQTFDLQMGDPNEEWRLRRKKTRIEIKRLIRAVAQANTSGLGHALKLHTEIFADESEEREQLLVELGILALESVGARQEQMF